MPSRSSTAIASISRSAHTLANSSGKEAPARKLNAERACNSVYISRTFPSETIPADANRNKSGTTHARWQDLKRDLKSVYFFVCSKKSELPHPIPLDPTGPATTLRKFATVPMRPQFRRASRKKIPAPEDRPAIPPAPECWDVKVENRWQAFPFASLKNSCPSVCPPVQSAFSCDRLPLPVPAGSAPFESHPGGAYPSVAASPHSRRPPDSRAAPWSAPIFPALAKQAEIIRAAWCAPGPLRRIALFL